MRADAILIESRDAKPEKWMEFVRLKVKKKHPERQATQGAGKM